MQKQSPRGVLPEEGVLQMCCGFSGAYQCVGMFLIKLQSSFVEIALLYCFSLLGFLHVCRASFFIHSRLFIVCISLPLEIMLVFCQKMVYSECNRLLKLTLKRPDPFCRANQLTGFYVMGTLVFKGLIVFENTFCA